MELGRFGAHETVWIFLESGLQAMVTGVLESGPQAMNLKSPFFEGQFQVDLRLTRMA